MSPASKNSFGTREMLQVDGKGYEIFRLSVLEKKGVGHVGKLPFSLRVLLENLLRQEDDRFVHAKDIEALASWDPNAATQKEISFMPARVLLQDFTGVPCVVDLAAMREAVRKLGGDPKKVNPLLPAELVIDHSVQVDKSGSDMAFAFNAELEFHRNVERYGFLRWGQKAFDNFKVVPPDTGIVHQINLEYLARVVFDATVDGKTQAFPDSLVGTDSHTTMINGLGVFGWGVGGIEAEAAMLGQPLLDADSRSRRIQAARAAARRRDGHGPGADRHRDAAQKGRRRKIRRVLRHRAFELEPAGPRDDRQHGARVRRDDGLLPGRCGNARLSALHRPGRRAHRLVEEYAKAQGLFRTDATPDPIFSDTLELDLATVEPTLAGPKRPQDRVPLRQSKASFEKPSKDAAQKHVPVQKNGDKFELSNGSVVIAAITSCTNTSNPSLMLGAGLLAKKAVERGLHSKPWVKTSLAPGSKVVTDYLEAAGWTNISTNSASNWSATAARRASAIAARSKSTSARPSRTTVWSPFPCSAEIAISRAAFIRWCARIIWRRRRWWSRMRSPAAWISTWPPNRSAMTKTASRYFCATSGLRLRKLNRPCAPA